MLRALTRFSRAVHRHVRAVWIGVAVALAVVLVSVITIDLGPAVRLRAERAGSNWLDRPLHIGRLGIRLGLGQFVVEDLRIDGLNPGDEPSLVARHIEVGLTWGALLHREVLLDSIEMDEWRMVVESWEGGRHSFPRFSGPPRPPRTGPAPVVTTLRAVHAGRGEFVYRDHGTPWSVTAPNLDVVVTKGGEYRGVARFDDGTISVRDYAPMRASLSTELPVSRADAAPRPHRPADHRRRVAGHRHRRVEPLAGADLLPDVEDPLPRDAGDLLAEGHLHAAW